MLEKMTKEYILCKNTDGLIHLYKFIKKGSF